MVSTNFAMMVRVRGDVSVEQLKAALDAVRNRHQGLIPTAFQGQAGGDVHFPLTVRTECGDQDWMEVAQTELRVSFESEAGPFARFTMLQQAQGFDLVGTFHHAKSDGMSGMYFLRDVLQVLGEPGQPLAPIPLPPPPPFLIPAAVLNNTALQRKMDWTISMLRVMIFIKKLRRQIFPRPQAEVVETSTTLPLSQHYVILTKSLSAAETDAVVARCKAEGVSVHGAVCAAWLRAFVNLDEGQTSWVRTVSSPVNLRSRLAKPIGDTSGMFLAIVETSVNCRPERNFWDIAREFKQKLNADSVDEKLFRNMLLFSKVFPIIPPADLDLLIELIFNDAVNYDFSITNLGRAVIPEKSGALQVEAFYGPLVNSSERERTVGINTFAGQMNLVLLFRESKMDPAQGQELMDQAVKLLLDASN